MTEIIVWKNRPVITLNTLLGKHAIARATLQRYISNSLLKEHDYFKLNQKEKYALTGKPGKSMLLITADGYAHICTAFKKQPLIKFQVPQGTTDRYVCKDEAAGKKTSPKSNLEAVQVSDDDILSFATKISALHKEVVALREENQKLKKIFAAIEMTLKTFK